MLPVAEAAKPTYTVTLFTTPPDCGMARILLYAPVALSDNWNPGGAVATIPFVKLFPEIVNCPICGVTEADPSQAEILPVTVLAVMVGGVGLMVMVKVVGTPVQPVPLIIKFPNAIGAVPTLILVVMAFVLVSITDTSFVASSVT